MYNTLSKFVMPTSLANYPLILTSFNRAFVFIVFVCVLAHVSGTFETGACRHNQRLDYAIIGFAQW
jgi:hypothetical protein